MSQLPDTAPLILMELPHLSTRLTDIIASLLYVERNKEIYIYKGIYIRDQVFVL